MLHLMPGPPAGGRPEVQGRGAGRCLSR